jgi:hypothetical protein
VNFTAKNISLVSMILMILGLLSFLFSYFEYSVYIYLLGAFVYCGQRIVVIKQQASNEVTRLPQIQLMSSISLLGAGYFMYDGSNSWGVLLLVSAVLELYVTFRHKSENK